MSTIRTAVMQRHPFADRGNDLYETPACATQALIASGEVERLGAPVWEPCAGRGAILRELKAAGFLSIAQDLVAYDGADEGIETPIDFLFERSARGPIAISYKIQDQLSGMAFALGVPVIVLLRLAALEGAARTDLIDIHLRRVWVGVKRLPMHRDGFWKGQRTVAALPRGLQFEPGKRLGAIELRRIFWRAT